MAVVVPPSLPMRLGRCEGRPKPAAGGKVKVLVTVTVLGSAGPLRFLVDDGDLVAGVIRAALRCYGREGRLPLLGNDVSAFALFLANGTYDELSLNDKVTFDGPRNFILYKKPAEAAVAGEGRAAPSQKKHGWIGSWKSGINKLFVNFRA